MLGPMFSGCPSVCACVRAFCGGGILWAACHRLLVCYNVKYGAILVIFSSYYKQLSQICTLSN